MDTLSFLRLIWPDQGIYLLAEPKSFVQDGQSVPYFDHYAYSSIEAAAQAAIAMSSAGTTVFFAMASVVNDYTRMNKQQREDAGVKVRGVHKSGNDNTCAVKSFWLDLDVGADPKKYASQHEASEALRAFCGAMSLPRPYVVSSGGGLHVYWPLSSSVDSETWGSHGAILKALAASYGLRADPSRTADRASVLRPVGTYNWKTGEPRPVLCLLEGKVNDTERFLQHLQHLKATTQIVVPERRIHQPASTLGAAPSYLGGQLIPAVNIEAATGAGYAQPMASDVVKKCPQLLWQLNNPQAVSEPSWYAMIGCLRFAEKGYKAVHLMSQGHPSYTPERTDDKLMQAENSGTGPTLCATFASHNPGGCDGCPMKDKIKTPLQAV